MRIFISHAVKDRTITDCLTTLISSGFGVNAADIFCSSAPGLGISGGEPFVDYVKKEMVAADFIFLQLSENYLASPFCLAELGASWIKDIPFIPLVLPNVSYSDLTGVLIGIQALPIDDERKLLEARDLFGGYFPSHKLPPTAHYKVRLDEFLSDFKKRFPKLSRPDVVSRAELTAQTEVTTVLRADILDLKAQLSEKKAYIKQLEKTKDQVEVRAIKNANSSDDTRFEAAQHAVRSAFEKLPDVAVDFLFYDYHRAEYWPKDVDVAKVAVEDGYLRMTPTEEYVLKRENRRVMAARQALEELSSFLFDVSQEWKEDFEDKHEFPPELENRLFFELVRG
ncbi:hypothetical protein BH09VER1_BH09VER1_29810 [soil metagenome]